ncbi:SF0329 family protein [Alloiococcus sp. CFN-8]|uniref:SF0329 family protein n=1 Tax=Alloiococcus sp. CFN-8 TaxID=3416081 RepID=UPI003CF851D5
MWSKTKKHLQGFLCTSLKERVDFFCSNYRIHDGIGRTYITVDGNEVYNMCTLKRDYYQQPKEGVYSQVEFIEAVNEYLNSPIEALIKSNNTLIKILVILDRRVGKRTLRNMGDTIITEEEIVQYFYRLRCDAEGIKEL